MEPVDQQLIVTESQLSALIDEIKRLDKKLTAQKEIEEVLCKTLDQLTMYCEKQVEKLTAQNERAREIEEKLCDKFDRIAENQEKQINMRIERLDQQFVRMQDFADEHHKLFIKECAMLLQLQTGNDENNNLQSQLQNRLDEATSRLTESNAEKDKLAERLHEVDDMLAERDAERNKLAERLDEAINRLVESDDEKNKLAERLKETNNRSDERDAENDNLAKGLAEANHKLAESAAVNSQLHIDLNNCRLDLQTSRELASLTKLRQLKELNELAVTEEISAVISRLKEDTAAIVVHIKKQDSVCSNAKEAEESGDGNTLDEMSSCLPDYIQRIQRIYNFLPDKLEANKVAAFMFTHDALTVKELQSIQHSHKTHCEASEELLKVIMEVKEQHVYDCFLKALRDTNQQHIWSWLSYDDYDIDCEHVQLIQKHYSFIVESMDARDSGLITELFARGVIDERDRGDIEGETSSIPMNEKLLSYLGRKTKEKFNLFLEAMSHTGQEHIVSELRGDEELHQGTLTPSTTSSRSIRANKSSTAVDTYVVATTSAGKIWTVTAAMEAPPNESQSPTLKHVIPSDGRLVVGLTFINNELFVLRDPSKEEIQVYETATFTQQRTVRVDGLIDDGLSWGKALTSCDVNNCLFVCDHYNVYKVDLSTDNVINWRVDGGPTELSVNDARHVIVTCYYGNELREYTATGQLIRTIKLQESHVTEPWHAVQLNESMFIVSHYGPMEGVSLIDTRGRVIATFINSESTQLLNGPRQLIVVKNGSVLVVDCDNNRLIVLDASLKNARELTLPIDGGLNGPLCLFFNESLGQLYVGEVSGQRVVICENISVE